MAERMQCGDKLVSVASRNYVHSQGFKCILLLKAEPFELHSAGLLGHWPCSSVLTLAMTMHTSAWSSPVHPGCGQRFSFDGGCYYNLANFSAILIHSLSTKVMVSHAYPHLNMVVLTKPGLTDVAMMPLLCCNRCCNSAVNRTLHSLDLAYWENLRHM